MRRPAGTLLALAGIGMFAAGALHPTGHSGQDFHAAIATMLRDPLWPVAHWCAVVSAFLAALSLVLLLDERESRAMTAGVRFGIVALMFMAVEFCVELAARTAVVPFAAGEPAPLVALIDAMQAVGFPALAVAFSLIVVGTRWTPRWVRVLGVAGAIALAIGGLVVQGLHVVALGPVFLAGNALPVWMVWAGVHLARARE